MNKDEQLISHTKYKSFARILLMILNICMSPFYFGYTITYMGTFNFQMVANIYNITIFDSAAEGIYNGCVPIGGGIGALTSFLLLKYLSRK